MGFADAGQGAASIVYLVLYVGLAAALVYALATRRPRLRFIGLSIFSAIRIGSQIAGALSSVLASQTGLTSWTKASASPCCPTRPFRPSSPTSSSARKATLPSSSPVRARPVELYEPAC